MITARAHAAIDQVLQLQDFFDRSALAQPDAIAVEVPPAAARPQRRRITYGELKRRSDVLAGRIRDTVAESSVVAVLLPRTTELLYVAQLAVLKSGTAFLCIDPAFPREHVRHILDDAQVAVLLTDAEGFERGRQMGYSGSIIRVDSPAVTSDETPPCSPSPPQSPDAAAYVIYTSGTTGEPKGVLIAHRSICNLVESDVEEFQLGPSDRVAQGSSAAYDSSIEETWMAFSTGATLVVMDDETARLGPDLVAWLRDEGITVLCPPPTLLRATGCKDPQTELPDLRLLYVGGEPLTEDVAERWARGRRMVNGYGPTECTVTCLRGDVIPTQRVTIGRPVPGTQAWVVDQELKPVPDGKPGELCIGGVGLAMGYHRRPGLDTERFPEHPQLGRIYRTGDLVQVTPDGTFLYHGRIDSQVKLRGYRIELEAIETSLSRCTGVREAACRVQGCGTMQTIAAHIVPWDAAHPPDPDALRQRLEETLPRYMVPSLFGTLTRLPRNASGKLNRSDLPMLTRGEGVAAAQSVRPRTRVEARIADAARHILSLGDDLSIDDDFFDNLGGSSVQAAMLISELRTDPATASLTVRDVYETRTVAKLARRATRTPPEADTVSVPRALPSATAATVVQTTFLLLELLLISLVAYLLVFQISPWLTNHIGLIPLIFVAPTLLLGLAVAFVPLSVLVAVLAKRVLIGRYRPIRAPVWGSFFVRSWLVQHVVRVIPWRLIEGTEFQCMALRALGARIGQRVHIHRGVNLLQGGWDVLEIGDDVTLSQDASLRLVTLEEGHVVVGPVTLSDGATLDVRSGVGRYAHVGRNSWLAALSALPPGGTIPDGEMWDGIPARCIGSAPEPPTLADPEGHFSPLVHGIAMILAMLMFQQVLLLPFQLSAVAVAYWFNPDYHSILAALSHPGAYWASLSAAAALFTVALICSLPLQALAARVLGTVTDGAMSRWSLAYVRVWMKARIVHSAGNWLSGTLFWPVWLRWAGMKIGQGCEISTIIDVVPELVGIGPRSFLADGVYLGGPRIQRGTVTVASVSLEENTFLGNHAVVAGGRRVPKDTLVGICTVADDVVIRSGTSWFGHPQLELPRREIVECNAAVTYNPSLVRLSNRLFWESLRFALPIISMLDFFTWVSALAATRAAMPPVSFVLIGVSAVTMSCAMLLCMSILLLKWVLLARVRPGIHPLWSCWCSRWDFLYVAWRLIARGVLTPLEGTLLLAMYLRVMGMKIGKRVVLGRGFAQVVDPDMLRIEDGATVNAIFQAHTFEDRVLKVDSIRVGSWSTLAENTVPLYGAEIGSQTYVAPHSVIMKHEHLQPGLRYEGAPTRTLLMTPPIGPSIDHVSA